MVNCLCTGATIIARWMCPLSDISFEDICKNLEDITNMVRARLATQEQTITSKTGVFTTFLLALQKSTIQLSSKLNEDWSRLV